jgi:hypothetical protein
MKNLIITGVTTVSAKVKDGETAYRLNLTDEAGEEYRAYFVSRGIYEDGIIKSFKRIQAIPLSKVNT